jgi:SAM-dependent methyltransferase
VIRKLTSKIRAVAAASKPVVLESRGVCPICETRVVFQARDSWLRDHFLCSGCGSIPRERALMQVIKTYYPNYRELVVHESSPCHRGASPKLRAECAGYSASQYFPDIRPGETHPIYKYQCQDLESLTFADASIDLFITQDVMEHIFDSEKAYREIARVLKPGGSHIFTVPLINKEKPSECWASKGRDNEINYHHQPEYHGNPVDEKGSLVTMHWGYDLADFIVTRAGTPTTIVVIDNLEMGIRAEYIEVLVSRKY